MQSHFMMTKSIHPTHICWDFRAFMVFDVIWKPQISTIFAIYVKCYCLQCIQSGEEKKEQYTLDVRISITTAQTIFVRADKVKGKKEHTKSSYTNIHIKNEIIFICEIATNCIESFTMRHNIFRNVAISILVP